MKEFTIINKVTKEDYVNLLVKMSYKKAITRFGTVAGCIFLLVAILGSLNIIPLPESSKPPIFQFAFGSMIFILPLITKMQAAKNYENSPRLHGDVAYTFSEDEVICKGSDFTSIYSWKSFFKIEEVGIFLILHTGENAVELLSKECLTKEQSDFIKLKVRA